MAYRKPTFRSLKKQKASPAAVSAAVLSLPSTPNTLAQTLKAQRARALAARQEYNLALNADEKLEKRRVMLAEGQKLAQLVQNARTKKSRADHKVRGVITVTPEQAKAEIGSLNAKLVALRATIDMLKKKHVKRQLAVALAQEAVLLHRIKLLQKGYDTVHAHPLGPSPLAHSRPQLALPSVYDVPSPGTTAFIIRMLASRVPKKSEDSIVFVQRLRPYVQRALVRYLKLLELGRDTTTAIKESVDATLTYDVEALEEEAAAGGTVADEVAEAMDAAIFPVEENLQSAAEDFSDLSQAVPTEEEVDELIVEAEGLETDMESLPPEDVDKLLAAEVPGSKPWYMNPIVWAAAAATALLLRR